MDRALREGYLGNTRQVFGLRKLRQENGAGLIEAYTSAGLQVDILPDTGLDIGLVRFKGINASFLSKNGYDSPASFLPYEQEFLHSYPGGLLYTCGLRNVGPAGRDGTEWHPLHGRVHGLAAEEVTARVDGDHLVIGGLLRETALFGHSLELRRRIIIPAHGSSIRVEDVLTNQSPRDEEFMLLYHCNFGYPLLSEHARLVLPEGRKTTPRTDFAATGLGQECSFDRPVDNQEERVFFHDMAEAWARLENPVAGMAATLRWCLDTLPVLAQWRSMASGDYALGLEPANNRIMGRAAERQNGTLQVIKAWQSIHTGVEISFEMI